MTAHQFNPTILREYDVRGTVDETLFLDDARALGRAFGTTVVRGGGTTVVVGQDGRTSSPAMVAALTEGLVSTGVKVKRIGLGPTPMLYFSMYHLDSYGAMMVTGSHNPPDYNGFKMMRDGGAVYGDAIQELGRLAAAGDFETGTGSEEEVDVFDAYIDRLVRDLETDKPFRIAWDPANGAAGPATQALVARLPGEHHVINAAVDGTFPNHPADPTIDANMDQLRAVVAEHGLDMGIGFDGDGDRIGLIDGKGRMVWGDQIIAILAGDVLRDLPGEPIIADVKASKLLFDRIRELGGRPVMWKSGHSLVKAKMVEEKAPLGGEMSGHIFFKHKFYGYDDGLYAAVRFLNAVDRDGGDLNHIMDVMPTLFNTPEVRFECPEERKFEVVEEVRARLADTPADVFGEDGVRVTDQDGWWLLRASNTQPALTARCEADTPAGLERLKAVLSRELEASGVSVPPELQPAT
ncbi:phosphoglucomutase/phosphomannomutase PgmG [Yunchengibacter salinarum]|uniref:phosphoglucomutase/phosphomannomutase PgmG n=1 Tax=Yunchengibacter salinarum TaxID=3133399 RepID=UPI0035B64F65